MGFATGDPMRILQVSDVHGSKKAAASAAELARRERVDLIVLAGDVTTFGTVGEVAEILVHSPRRESRSSTSPGTATRRSC
jgi:Predicted phosphoesterases, related to the Icc protein